MTPQKANNHTVEDLVDSEREESPVSDVRRMIIRMFEELIELQKQLNEYQEDTDKKLEKTQKLLTEVKEDFNKL
jgi:hypothetical protein